MIRPLLRFCAYFTLALSSKTVAANWFPDSDTMWLALFALCAIVGEMLTHFSFPTDAPGQQLCVGTQNKVCLLKGLASRETYQRALLILFVLISIGLTGLFLARAADCVRSKKCPSMEVQRG
jgi:hypothetical protein